MTMRSDAKKHSDMGHSTATAKLSCVDLFCGCGGMSLGFEKAGFEVKAGFELWDPAMRVYAANFKHPVLKQDLSKVDEAVAKIKAYSPDLIVGGPPCQDFSTAGHQDESRGRAILSIYYSQIVSAIRPKYFVMENVKGILTKDEGRVKQRILREIRSIVDENKVTLLCNFINSNLKQLMQPTLYAALYTKICIETHNGNYQELQDAFFGNLDQQLKDLTKKKVSVKIMNAVIKANNILLIEYLSISFSFIQLQS